MRNGKGLRGQWLAIGLLALLGGSCHLIVDPDLPVQPAACKARDTNPCLCRDGSDGIQRCEPDGSFGACKNGRNATCDGSGTAGVGD